MRQPDLSEPTTGPAKQTPVRLSRNIHRLPQHQLPYRQSCPPADSRRATQALGSFLNDAHRRKLLRLLAFSIHPRVVCSVRLGEDRPRPRFLGSKASETGVPRFTWRLCKSVLRSKPSFLSLSFSRHASSMIAGPKMHHVKGEAGKRQQQPEAEALPLLDLGSEKMFSRLPFLSREQKTVSDQPSRRLLG